MCKSIFILSSYGRILLLGIELSMVLFFSSLKRPFHSLLDSFIVAATSTFRLIVVLLKIMCLCIRMNCLSFGFTTMCLFKLPCVCILSGAYTVSWIGCLLSFSVYFLIIQILLPVVLMPCFLFYISTPGGTAISPVSDPITTSHTFLRVYYRSMLWSGYYLDTILPFSDLLVRCV